jgi:hypothetical protein
LFIDLDLIADIIKNITRLEKLHSKAFLRIILYNATVLSSSSCLLAISYQILITHVTKIFHGDYIRLGWKIYVLSNEFVEKIKSKFEFCYILHKSKQKIYMRKFFYLPSMEY